MLQRENKLAHDIVYQLSYFHRHWSKFNASSTPGKTWTRFPYWSHAIRAYHPQIWGGAYVFTIRIFWFIREKWVLLNRSSPILASLSRSCRLLRILLYDGGILDSLKGPVSDRSNGFLTCGRLYLFDLFLTKTLFYGIPGVNPRRACPAGRLFNITRAELQISSFSFSCKNGYSAALFFP